MSPLRTADLRRLTGAVAVGVSLAASAAAAQTAAPAPHHTDFLALDPSIAQGPDAAARFGDHVTIVFRGAVAQLHSSVEVSSVEAFDATSIPGWPEGWDHVDAAYAANDATVALIKDGTIAWLVFDDGNEEAPLSVRGEPEPFAGDGGPLPADWGGEVDAALALTNDRFMLFRGEQFVTVDNGEKTVTGPQSFREWPGWPADWDRVDAAANPGYGVLYFFRDGAYLAWDQGRNAVAFLPPQSMAPEAPLVDAVADRLKPASRTVENKPVRLHVANRTDRDLEILWVGFDGELRGYNRLAPFEEYVQGTFDGHLWYARQGDAILAAYRASADDDQHFMIFDQPQAADLPAEEEIVDPHMFVGRNEAILPYPSTDWLGAGFDLAHVDPANLGAVGPPDDPTTARRRSPFSLMLSPGRSSDQRYMLHHGVRLTSSSTTADDDKERVITSVEDLAEELDLGLTQGIDVGVAAFSRALSYQHVNTSSTGRDSIYLLHRALAKNDRLELDLVWPVAADSWRRQRLDPSFEVQVSRLGATCGDGYDQLLARFGSHYATSVQFGGQYTLLTRIDKSTYNRFEGDKAAFEQHLRVTVPDTPVSASSGQSAGGGRSQGSARSDEFTDTRRFISGGEGFSDRDEWLASLGRKPAPVDITFAPVTDLLTATFFPDDARIYAKQETLRDCAEARYAALGQTFESHAARGAAPFFEKEIPEELKKKTPDYLYVVDARIVDSKEQCNSVSDPAAFMKAMNSVPGNPIAGLRTYKGRMDHFIDFNLNYGGAFTGAKYLCLVRAQTGKPLTRLYPISHNAASGSSSCEGGDRRLPTNINDKWNNFGQSDYVCVGSNPNEHPLYDVAIRAVAGSIPDHTHRPSSAGMVLNAGDILLYLHTMDVKQASDAGRIGGANVDVVGKLALE